MTKMGVNSKARKKHSVELEKPSGLGVGPASWVLGGGKALGPGKVVAPRCVLVGYNERGLKNMQANRPTFRHGRSLGQVENK